MIREFSYRIHVIVLTADLVFLYFGSKERGAMPQGHGNKGNKTRKNIKDNKKP